TDSTPRPIPSIPVDVPVDSGEIDPDLPDLDSPLDIPISIVITTGVEGAINILPGVEQSVSYEVFGGRPQDGAIRVQLIYDGNGIDRTGDEVVLVENLPVRGTIDYPTLNIPPGSYFVGIRASNTTSSATRFAASRLEIVGAATAQLTRPTADLRVRPSGTIQVRGSIETLARNVAWTVFTDQDGVFNGNEVDSFAGGGKAVDGAIFPLSLPRGDHFLGITIRDSLGQDFVRYFSDGVSDCVNGVGCRKFTVDAPPEIVISSPTASIIAQPGDAMIHIEAVVSDAEGDAAVTIFRDADGTLNNNEFDLATFQLSGPSDSFSFDFDTTNLFPGLYRFGVKVDDGGGVVATYAAGTLNVPLPPSVSGEVLLPANGRIGHRTDQETATVRFRVTDPNRRLRLQPLGIVVNLYRDDNTDGVRDSATPLQTLTNGRFGIPFAAGNNEFEVDLSTLALDPGADGTSEVLVEILLSEVIGNDVKVDPEPAIRLDTIEPNIQVTFPGFPVYPLQVQINSLSPDLEFTYELFDNNEVTVTLVMVNVDTSGFYFIPDGTETIEPNDVISRTVQLHNVEGLPSGDYILGFVVQDSTAQPIDMDLVAPVITISN
ncbi:MAG: hypothetical protein AB7N71_04710, partial [Phycisphaerae bacterium]